ncbi:class I SAM-dependent methyltransferase [Stappia sp. F7233]|uniref:Class I SAM-dependent methyltransferase n=1 Tax=Stappia albiluteola TaxID=2758565 RepID=A0A839AHM5_9HYPH|nr:class I SAM-dependent methyltransferase [Stappia albiluteola]MBA5778538.1 class I SAM-dependent methyltransferase [Stappia albiluteola]
MTDDNCKCRFCGSRLETVFADLGSTPLSNSYVTRADIEAGRDRSYPLVVRVCEVCFLVQADEVVRHAEIFDADYTYFSSYSDSWVAHAGRYARAMTERYGLTSSSLVAEVASNDGYLLQHFHAAGVPVLGIEPTASTANAAIARGIPTRIEYFGNVFGRQLAEEGLQADLIAANNVLAHVPDILDFSAGFRELLKEDGVATFEFPHILNLIRDVQFDTIYHEHFSYLGLLTIERIFKRAGLRVFDVEELPTHGGSLRLFACRLEARHGETPAVEAMRAKEREAKLDSIGGYAGFPARIENCLASFRRFLTDVRAAGKTVAAYGAAAKGNTFFNVCGVTAADIPLIADRSHAKQGKFLPGSHIPIVSPESLIETRPDYVVIVPWNLASEVRSQLKVLEGSGTRFVTAIPETRVL